MALEKVFDTALKPTPKVAAAGALGAPLALVIVYAAGLCGLAMPVEVAAAIGALISAGVAYFKKD